MYSFSSIFYSPSSLSSRSQEGGTEGVPAGQHTVTVSPGTDSQQHHLQAEEKPELHTTQLSAPVPHQLCPSSTWLAQGPWPTACGTAGTNLSVQPGLLLRQQSDPWHLLSVSFFTHQDHSLFLLLSWSSKSQFPCQPPAPWLSLLPATRQNNTSSPPQIGTQGQRSQHRRWRGQSSRLAAQSRSLRCVGLHQPNQPHQRTPDLHMERRQTALYPLWN